MYQIKEFLKVVGWIVAGSSDGATGGMDSVDRITNGDMLSDTDRWFVMRSPHVNVAERIQLLFSKPSNQANAGSISYNPNADYAGASTSVPTSAYERLIYSGGLLVDDTTTRYHMTADDAAPHGFAVLGHRPGLSSTSFSMAVIPLDTQPPVTPGKPYVVYAGGAQTNNFSLSSIFTQTLATTTGHCVAEGQVPPQTPAACTGCALELTNGSVIVVPNGVGNDPANKDQMSPIIFQTTEAFYGTSSFMRWNGNPRNLLDTLEDSVLGVRGRIVIGDVNFPWDGVTPPELV